MQFVDLPPECIQRILCYLSYPQVTLSGALSRVIRVQSTSQGVWHSLYFTRWPGRMTRGHRRAVAPIGDVDWHARFRKRLCDIEGSEERVHWSDFNLLGDSNQITAVVQPPKRYHGDPNHLCDPASCSFVQIEDDSFLCVFGGSVHRCEPCRDGFACRSAVESTESMWVCPISARSFQSSSSGFDRGTDSSGNLVEISSSEEGEWAGYPCCSLDKAVIASDNRKRLRR